MAPQPIIILGTAAIAEAVAFYIPGVDNLLDTLQVMSPDEPRRVLAVATSLRARVALSLCYGCGLCAGEVVRLKVKHIDSAQKIIRIEQSKGRKDRNVMLSPEMIDLLRQWWKARRGFDAHTTPLQERWLFPGRKPGMPMTTRQLNRLFHEAADGAGIK